MRRTQDCSGASQIGFTSNPLSISARKILCDISRASSIIPSQITRWGFHLAGFPAPSESPSSGEIPRARRLIIVYIVLYHFFFAPEHRANVHRHRHLHPHSSPCVTDRDISRRPRTIRRGVYTVCDSWLLYRGLAGAAVHQFQPVLHVPPATSNFNYHIRVHGDYPLP